VVFARVVGQVVEGEGAEYTSSGWSVRPLLTGASNTRFTDASMVSVPAAA